MVERVWCTDFSFPRGTLFIASTERGICSLSLGGLGMRQFLGELREKFEAEPVEDSARFERLFNDLRAYFSGKPIRFNHALDLSGATDFQKKVWLATEKIPYGKTRTYRQVAEAIGRPKAFRAVGQALRANPIPILIPCHRVIGSDGGLVGFSPGLEAKEWLLRLEGLP